MGITSFKFVGFVAASLLVWRLVPAKYRWMALFASSLVFYGSLNLVGLPILAATTAIIWFAAIRVQGVQDAQSAWLEANKRTANREQKKEKKRLFLRQQRVWLVGALLVCLGNLVLCKYYSPTSIRLNAMLDWHLWTAENIIVPLGISYYSLLLTGYLLDVYRGIVRAERNPLKVMLFSSLFLSVMQGPFNRYGDLMPQISDGGRRREWSGLPVWRSLVRIGGGYIKKMCIADQLAVLTAEIFGHYTQYEGLGIALGIVCFAIQLYADFSGYMDIVVGIGQLFGIRLPENFKEPFFSRNISEFWRRWHITLGLWLKDYVFYPTLKTKALKSFGKWLKPRFGKKASRSIPTYVGMLVLWLLIGLWHGASFNFVFGTGILQFIYIFTGEVFEPLFVRIRGLLKVNVQSLGWHVFQSVRTTLLMMVAWTFFNASGFAAAVQMLGRLFTLPAPSQIAAVFESDAMSGVLPSHFLPFVVACGIVLLVIDLLRESGRSVYGLAFGHGPALGILVLGAMAICFVVFGAYGAHYDASNFIYFEF